MSTNKIAIGEVRPSQLLWTYGPGALVDMPSLSVVTLGTDQWEKDRCTPIKEARLLAAVQEYLGSHIQSLRRPPFVANKPKDRFSAEAQVGVPVRPFPRWLRCVKCGMLAEFDSGLFEVKPHFYRPENTRFVHQDCRGSDGSKPPKDADAVPARFLLACRNGHLDDFPWSYYVHGGHTTCRGSLRFFEGGASLQTENLWVKCDECGSQRNLAQAFGTVGLENLPACRGRHPHLDRFDSECDQPARAVLLGATNSWFPVTLSALAIPLDRDPLTQLVNDGWEDFADVEDQAELKGVVKSLVKNSLLPGIEKYEIADIWEAIECVRNGTLSGAVTQAEIKAPEWEVFTQPDPKVDWPHFLSERVDVPHEWSDLIEDVLLLKRLREVNALVGFTRVEAPEETDDPDDRPPMAQLNAGEIDWVPASEVHGEGVFVRFSIEALENWESRDAVKVIERELLAGHQGWRLKRRLDPNEAFPGVRYVMLHTLSHLLIRELALECGYNAASIRERIYADVNDRSNQAGILLYTAAADSDGTLGGLVDLGSPENMGRLMEQALNRAKVCSSDPLCSEHAPRKDQSLHGAACHACSFAAETSCEKGNRYLDRSLVVPTFLNREAAFFG